RGSPDRPRDVTSWMLLCQLPRLATAASRDAAGFCVPGSNPKSHTSPRPPSAARPGSIPLGATTSTPAWTLLARVIVQEVVPSLCQPSGEVTRSTAFVSTVRRSANGSPAWAGLSYGHAYTR